MSGTRTRRHFHTFDALRFFAFFKVFLLHLPFTAFPWFNYIKAGGGIGVQFFFVLSGFLITYIILEEQQQTSGFDLKNFFMRRVLRIWPLYYLMVGVAFVTPFITEQILHINTSADGYEPQWGMSLLFLENYKMMFTGEHPNVSPLGVMWSLCIEEHFYIIWGLLFWFLRKKGATVIIIASIITGIISRIIYTAHNIPSLDILTNIDLFAYGAIPAYILINKPAQLYKKIEHIPHALKVIFVIALLLIVTLLSQHVQNAQLFIWATTLLGILFAMLIALTLPPDTRFRIRDKNLLSRSGVFTYGLYVYHTIIINLLLHLFPKVTGLEIDTSGGAILFTIVSLAGSIIISIASYHLFEKHFLKLKKYFRK